MKTVIRHLLQYIDAPRKNLECVFFEEPRAFELEDATRISGQGYTWVLVSLHDNGDASGFVVYWIGRKEVRESENV